MAAASASCPTSCRASRSPSAPPTSSSSSPQVEGLILHKHGIFTFGEMRARAYERMIELVTRAEERLRTNRKAVFVTAPIAATRSRRLAEVAPILRGACSLPGREDRRRVAAARSSISAASDAILNFVNGAELARYGQAGVVTPDHTIRTKNWPLILPAPEAGKLGRFQARGACRRWPTFVEHYKRLFRAPQRARRRQQEDARPAAARRAGAGPRPVRPRPLAQGRARSPPTSPNARSRPSPTPRRSAASSRSREADMFDMEYWPLEQAKLGAAKRHCRSPARSRSSPAPPAPSAPPTAKAFAAAGAEVALLDLDRDRGAAKARSDRRRRARGRLRRDRRGLGARSVRSGGRAPSAASISWCRMPAPPGRAASARSTRRCCARASN